MIGDTLNAVRWRGKRHRGIYEVWYLTVVDPTTGDGYWFRYTIDAPTNEQTPIVLGLWAITTPKAGGGVAAHDVHPVAKFANKSSEEKGIRLDVGPGFLERAKAKGKVGSGANAVEWDLNWDPKGSPSVEHVSPALEALGIASSSVNSGYLSIAVNGTIKVAGKAIKLDKWPGHQSHTWGRRHMDDWTWAHCNAFTDDAQAVFEGVSANATRLGIALPTATPLYLRLAGTPDPEIHEWTGPGSLWSNRSKFSLGRWEFESESSDILMKGVATCTPDRLIAVEYAEPTGERLWCHNTTTGDLKLDLYRRVGARWSLEKTLESKGTTAMEFGSRARDPRVTRALTLADAKVIEEPKPAGVA